MPNRYAPPTANVSDSQLAPGSAIKGVLAGLAVDLIGTMLGGVAIGIGYAFLAGVNGQSVDSLHAASAQAATFGSPVNVLSLIVGSIFSVSWAGMFASAWLADKACASAGCSEASK